MAKLDCTLFILSYKGLPHLQALLPTVRALLEASPTYLCRVVIIENGQDNESEVFVNQYFPEFTFSFAPKNDFLFSFNSYVAQAQSPFVFILNNDLRLSPDILNLVFPYLENDPNLFAVTCTLMDWEGKNVQEAVKVGTTEKGWLYLKTLTEIPSLPTYSLHACGGASIYRTEMFNSLRGFDPLYRPAYFEDTDLSLRAWNRGWSTINVPTAIVYHREGGSWKNEKRKNALEQLIHRNKVVGMARNIHAQGFLLTFLVSLPKRLISSYFMDRNFHIGLLKSIPLLPKTLIKRNSDTIDKKAIYLALEKPGQPYLK